MELKRIVAKDLRSATERAVSLYGKDALVISHELVNGQTEIIVATDIQADGAELFEASAAPETPRTEATDFRELLTQNLEGAIRPDGPHADAPSSTQEDLGDRDRIRAREIVDLVRQEMASLRRELRVGQQGLGFVHAHSAASSSAARQLDRALENDHAPSGLRMLLSEELAQIDSIDQGLVRLADILRTTLNDTPALEGPLTGLHALFGPSGAGKTTMIARLALQASDAFGPERVTVISWADSKPGAWNHIQLACSRVGVECVRCQDPDLLHSLIEDLGARATILIDTPGIEMIRNRQRLADLVPEAQLHLVLPADVASHQAERLLRSFPWQSLLLSKLDEAHHAWGIISALSHTPAVLYHQAGSGFSAAHAQDMSVSHLVKFAVDRLGANSLDIPVQTDPARMKSSVPGGATWAAASRPPAASI